MLLPPATCYREVETRDRFIITIEPLPDPVGGVRVPVEMRLMPNAITLAKQLKQKCQRIKYRNMKITETGVSGEWTTAGPTM